MHGYQPVKPLCTWAVCHFLQKKSPRNQNHPTDEASRRDNKRFIKSNSVIPSALSTMDHKAPNNLHDPFFFQSNKESSEERHTSIFSKTTGNPFADTFLTHPDPLCKLNLRGTSDFVKSFPVSKATIETKGFVDSPSHSRRGAGPLVSQRRLLEAPRTPGRNFLPFSTIGSPITNLSRKPFPSKWDDAEKWLVSASCNGSPAHIIKSETQKVTKQHNHVFTCKSEPFAEKIKASEVNITLIPTVKGPHPSDIKSTFLDKFTANVEPLDSNLRYCEPTKGGFLFSSSVCKAMKDAGTEVVGEVNLRDVGTEMTPLGSTMNSRCPTPIKLPSPPRHNTPAACSGPLGPPISPIDISEINDYYQFEPRNRFDSVDLYPSNWNSREEEEEEISRSLRHFEVGNGRKSTGDSKASIWEDGEKAKCCIRYLREEAKIHAWVNLQNAKAEAQSRKLEVKVQEMRSDLEEKLMKRMAMVQRKAEDWRASAQFQHSQDMLKPSQQSSKLKTQNSLLQENPPCRCF